jgi:glycosyltransferase involved in cell wall biosynthesis
MKNVRVALVHYWLTAMRGGEKVLDELARLFPQAHVFTNVVNRAVLSPELQRHEISTTFINRLPFARHLYRHYVGLMPWALEELDLSSFDIVISSESGPAKGVITRPDTLHLCYCHTPMRYLWQMYHEYKSQAGPGTRLLMGPVFHHLRIWDYASAARVDYFAANSATVAARIHKYYRRDAIVIHPPVDTACFARASDVGEFYLVCGQLVDYKRVDLAISAFNMSGRKLIVIGGGPALKKLRRMAGPNVTFMGPQPSEILRHHYARARALVFPGEEDFGIVPVEAMASGCPVIAFARGGAVETCVDGLSGVFFEAQTPASIIDAVRRFEAMETSFDPSRIITEARQFDREVFATKFMAFAETAWEEHQRRSRQPHLRRLPSERACNEP